MSIVLLVRTAGVLMILLALLHGVFPKRFQWNEELARLSPLNRQIFTVHVLFIVLILLLMGSLSLFYANLLTDGTKLSRVVLAGIAIFWGLRLFAQLFIYRSSLWRGNRFNTIGHVIFTLLWSFFTVVYLAALFTGRLLPPSALAP